ncbi:unnamed protein product [Tilletia controversa]|uniref:MARVEL domain-containing protein n=3 Tax=Tilletia TaxID=13289 RepID=A0A8X7MLP6_9BASI|nr:hypothetical protein CF335_g8235 [Tilletia laevis]KAE8186855.1 hypothetical protein CF328_g7102 [Tilletia controversa]KAE8246646.1 hypothetical protein A4X03_0g7233 [Tilletia caries]KAE8184990.1 hypothetical protein CF336_g7588 [Tilletia laevis]KAE8240896.1 hypothetical protein A4X06_0g7746 [Tilletia controversa]
MVDYSNHVRRGHPIAFILLAFWSFVFAVIASSLTSDFHKNPERASQGIKDRVHFMVFVGWWTFLFSIVYLGLFLKGIGGVVTSIAGHGVWLILTWLFMLAGSAALADKVPRGHCELEYCRSLKALEAFGWISFIQLSIMLVVIGVIGGGAFRGGRGLKEGITA